MIELSPLNDLATHLKKLIHSKLWVQVIIGLLLGVSLGAFLNPSAGFMDQERSSAIANWLDLPGSVFLRLVQMVMIPLVFASIISGIVSNNSDKLKKMGPSLLVYFIGTTVVSISIGVLVASFFKPGESLYQTGGFSNSPKVETLENMEAAKSIPEMISELIPNNPFEAILTGEMLGVVIFTVIIAVAITQLKTDTSRSIIRLIEAMQKICMIVISWAMTLVPFAVFGLMAALVSRLGLHALTSLGFYAGVVILGLGVLLIFYLSIFFLITQNSPFKFLNAIREPQLLAFSTASSAAVMPLSMKVADEKLNVSSNISDFVIPVGATINMDGTALFQTVTALFMSQAYGLDLSILEIIIISFTVVGASIGTPAIPGGGVIILASVLGGLGIPTDGLIIIIGIDRILGMFRTTLNVTGDLVAASIFNKWYGPISKVT